jgi:hypothetical protein
MIRMFTVDTLRSKARNAAIYIQMVVLAVAGASPLLVTGQASAAQLTSRSVTISTSKPAAAASYNFKFSWASATDVKGVILQFCDSPLGTCNLPGNGTSATGYAGSTTAMNLAAATRTADAGFPGGANDFVTPVTSTTGACNSVTGATRTMICLTGTGGTAATATDATLNISGITNPALPDTPAKNNTTVYVRISLYSNTTFNGAGNPVFDGTVAASINQQLTVNGRVQERLNFCVAAIGDGGSTDTTLPTDMASCGALSTSVVDLGVIDNSSVAQSPVDNNPPTTQGNDSYGIAMVNTNASNGVSVTYFAEPDPTGGATNQLRAFRVPGAACNATAGNLLDQCFRSAVAGTSITAGNEYFGLNIPCIIAKDGANPTVNSVLTTTQNLVPTFGYDNNAATTTQPGVSLADYNAAADCENSDHAAGTSFQWNDTSTAAQLASSTSVVDNEIIKLNFGASAAATTPTGSYTVVSTYIATPTF